MNGNTPEQLIAFVNFVAADDGLQSQVKAAENPKQIIEIAASAGYEISLIELRMWSKELSASYFPWSTKGAKWRRNFFTLAG